MIILKPIRLLVYPFTQKVIPLLKYFDSMQKEYWIEAVVLPPAYSWIGEDLGKITNRKDIHYTAIQEYEVNEKDDSLDGILLLSSTEESSYMIGKGISYIDAFLESGKIAICLMELDGLQREQFAYKANKFGGEFRYIKRNELKDVIKAGVTGTARYSGRVPFTIFVGGCIDVTYDYEITLSLINMFRKYGLTVSGICNESSAVLMNLHICDFEAAKSQLMLSELIKKLRDLIRIIVQKEDPDIVIIQLPEPMIKLSDEVPNGYGLMTYIYDAAVKPDLVVSSLPLFYQNSEIISQINQNLNRVYQWEVDCFFVSNFYLNYSISEQVTVPVGLYCPFPELTEYPTEYSRNLLESSEMEKYVNDIMIRYLGEI